VDFNLTVNDVEISHCRHVCSCVLKNSILHPSSDIFMVRLRAMFHSLNAASVSCSNYTGWRVSLSRMLDAQTLPSAAAHRCAALVSHGMLSSVPPHSLGRWGCLKCRGARIEFGHLVRHFKHRCSHLHPCTVSHLHNCALTTRQPRLVIVVSLEGRKASWTPKCSVFGSVTRSQQISHFEIYSAVLPICMMPTAVKALWNSSGTDTRCD
jgi:hypothetical protein